MIATQAINPDPAVAETATDADGWVYEVNTGEVIGRLDADGYLVRERFEVTDAESADWVLSLYAAEEAEVLKLDIQFAALKKNYDARRQARMRRVAYLDWKYRPSLVAFARSTLSGKARFWQGAYGRVSFRKTPGSAEVIDDAAAVEFVKTWKPSLVKVRESVGVKDVLACRAEAESATGEVVILPFVVVSPPGESVEVRTGVETTGGKR